MHDGCARKQDCSAGRICQDGFYRIHWYPGMRKPIDPNDLVTGELYRLLQPSKTLEVLDGYEGKHDYRRELHGATLENGRKIQAWVYMYLQRRPEDCRVFSGEW